MKSIDDKQWFVLRDLKRANAKDRAYDILQAPQYALECVFTPLVKKEFKKNGRRQFKYVPYIYDLLFVYATKRQLDPIISGIPTLQYRFVKGCQANDPMVVRDKEMENFIELASDTSSVEYFSVDEIMPYMYGKKIKISGGELDGVEGVLLSKKGSKKKRLMVKLESILSAVVEVSPDYIKIVE